MSYKDLQAVKCSKLATFTCLEKLEPIDAGFIKLERDRVQLPNSEHSYIHSYLLHPGASVIVPFLDTKTLLMVYQYRYSIKQWILEFPAGTFHNPHDDPQKRALEELREETGYLAKTLTKLGILHPSPGMIAEIQHIFEATDLTFEAIDRDSDELMEVVGVPVADINKLIKSGEFTDAKSIAAWHMLGCV